jgi:hypothetical protein
MPYLTTEDLSGDMPYDVIQQALNDGSGSSRTPEEVWTAIQAAVEKDIHGALAPRFTPPYEASDGILDTVFGAARILTLQTLYRRRPFMAENPYAKEAEEAMKHLRKLGQGEMKAPSTSPAPRKPTVRVFSETMRTRPAET